MINNLFDEEAENTPTRFPETGNLLPEKDPEIQGEGDTDFDRDVIGETLPAVQGEPPKSENLADEAMNFVTRIFSADGEGFKVRPAKDRTGTVWFVADDVCKVLGYTKKTADVIKAHCRKVIDSKDLIDGETEMAHKATIEDANGHGQAMIVISEPDVFRLILRSRMPRARVFERWVMEEVLPQLRHTGKYSTRRKIDYTPQSQTALPGTNQVSGQCELFPRMVPSVSLPADITDRLNSVKKRLFEQGHTFPNNKEFVKFLVNKALEDLEG